MALDLDALRIFLKVAELGSFTRAGEQLRVPKAKVSLQVKALEEELGCALLLRTTRLVQLTADGEQLLGRARHLVTEADEVAAMFQTTRHLRGRVAIDLPVNVGRAIVIPRLPELLARHPGLELIVSTTDRTIDPRREGYDIVLRIGVVRDGALVGRRLGAMRMMNAASPAYLRKHGQPHSLADLDQHLIVRYGADTAGFEYVDDSGTHDVPMRHVLTVNSVDAYQAAGLAGLGIIQGPRIGLLGPIAAGTLMEVLPGFACAPMPVSLLHTHGRSVPRRVRAVITWLTDVLAPHIESC